jgi:predicted ATP-dependent serine protease
MKTGIEFFDRQEPKPGDLWIVASGPAMGKSTVLRNIAVGLGDHLVEGHIAYWDVEHTPDVWRENILRMGCAVPASLSYRNEEVYHSGELVDLLTRSAASASYRAVVVDKFDLVVPDVAEALPRLKIWLVRTGKFGLVSLQLRREVWGKLKSEGEINPDSLPEHMLDNADAVFTCGKTPQRAVDGGAADTLRVIVCKSPTGLRDPDNHHAFLWDHQTGRLS